MTGSNKAQTTGMLGVYLTAAELTNQGFIVSPTSRSAMGADLLVVDERCRTAWSVQVKTQRQAASYWLVGERAHELSSPTHIYVFVNLQGEKRPEYLVVPSRIVASKTYEDKGFHCFDKAEGKEFILRQNWPDERAEGWEIFSREPTECAPLPPSSHLRAVSSFISLLERLSFEDLSRRSGGDVSDDGVITLPYPDPPREVTALVEVLYALGFVTEFDWGAWEVDAERYSMSPELVSHADLNTCVQLLTTHVRKDRFCEGHLVDMISSGHVANILQRLKALA